VSHSADFERILGYTDKCARACTWNGNNINIIEAPTPVQAYEMQGVNEERKTIYCRLFDLIPQPKVAQAVVLDGDTWYIESITTNSVYTQITMRRSIA